MAEQNSRSIHECPCSECLKLPIGETAQLHASINRLVATLDEKHRRQFAGLLASQFGRGGVQYMAVVTGLNRKTISRGKSEIERANFALGGRSRAEGGGRQATEKKSRSS